MNSYLVRFILLFLGLLQITPVSADTIITLSRDRQALFGNQVVTLPVLQALSSEPKGIFIMLTGGNGILNIEDGNISINSKTFLLRSRDYFVAEGFHALLMDAPSDLKLSGTGLTGYRLSPEHTSDIKAVIRYARGSFPGLPVWLIGTSRGTASAANASAILNNSVSAPDGLVLASSLTRPAVAASESLAFIPLELITKPVLLVHHKKDACPATPVEDVKLLRRQFKTNSVSVKKLVVNGGSTPIQENCAPLSYHTFFGIEKMLVEKITKWVSDFSK